MIIARIFVNRTEIDEIHILNVSVGEGKFSRYIASRKGDNKEVAMFRHKREDGYEKCLSKGLLALAKRDK